MYFTFLPVVYIMKSQIKTVRNKMMPNKIKIDTDGDNDYPVANKPRLVYFTINEALIVVIKYKADFEENGERGEYWGRHLAVEANTWIEVNKVDILGVEAVYDIEGEELPLSSYTLAPDDEMKMQQRIEDMICGIETETKAGYDHYSE